MVQGMVNATMDPATGHAVELAEAPLAAWVIFQVLIVPPPLIKLEVDLKVLVELGVWIITMVPHTMGTLVPRWLVEMEITVGAVEVLGFTVEAEGL